MIKSKVFAGLAAALLIMLFFGCEIPLVPEGERVFRVTVTVTGTVAVAGISSIDISFPDPLDFEDPDGDAWVGDNTFLSGTVNYSQEYTGIVDYSSYSRYLALDVVYEFDASGQNITATVLYEELVPDGWSSAQILYSASDTNESTDPIFGRITESVLLPPPP
jgi:hypothetical protein